MTDPAESIFDNTVGAIKRRAFELHLLRLIQGYGLIQDERIKEQDGSFGPALFLKAELEGEYPETRVTLYTFARAEDVVLESQVLIWGSVLSDDDITDNRPLPPLWRIADGVLIRSRGEEFESLTIDSAAETEWRDKYAAVSRRAYELHVLQLIQETSPAQDVYFREAQGRSDPLIFLRAELKGEYPKTGVMTYMYDRVRDLVLPHRYPIWQKDLFANGEVADVEYMRPPMWVNSMIMMWARGG